MTQIPPNATLTEMARTATQGAITPSPTTTQTPTNTPAVYPTGVWIGSRLDKSIGHGGSWDSYSSINWQADDLLCGIVYIGQTSPAGLILKLMSCNHSNGCTGTSLWGDTSISSDDNYVCWTKTNCADSKSQTTLCNEVCGQLGVSCTNYTTSQFTSQNKGVNVSGGLDCYGSSAIYGTCNNYTYPIYWGNSYPTPTPLPSATPTATPNWTATPQTYCNEVDGSVGGEGFGDLIPHPTVGVGPCLTINAFDIPQFIIDLLDVFGITIPPTTFPGMKICIDPMKFGDLQFFGTIINMDLWLFILGAMFAARLIWRS
jgi:hypothetical protein